MPIRGFGEVWNGKTEFMGSGFDDGDDDTLLEYSYINYFVR